MFIRKSLLLLTACALTASASSLLQEKRYNAMCGEIGGPPYANGNTPEAMATRRAVCGGVASSNRCDWCYADHVMASGDCTTGCCENMYQKCS
ncbi:hypothetical protein MKEN_00395400 [Mycena kentingensis (nom. inval.)]|nr:hypothetical protein MKEN_00395400 [Mycena kentingensis (nom. inval.)]